MSDIVVAKRYAKALFELASERGIIAQVEDDLGAVVASLQDHADFKKLLQHPNVAVSVKTDMLQKTFEGKVSETVLNTLQMLVSRRREALLTTLYTDYVKIANEALGQASAIVYTPFELSEDKVQDIADHFGKVTGKKLRIQTVIDPALLGGIQVRIGDRLYDGSLSGKLERLQKSLTQAL
ncbi:MULTISPECIES: F0F1 ATP synthase subunit delta [unclassified Paenibacillus]|uniref:F0F1 ATP synthase subunit delta n=1 Tax=unclassified Paenibacillus TaxID=185978 RepID=UPI00277EACB9|nr:MULTISPECIES: F0F1 ATP synthase subunit delta [unclassified Paenibacillus]MDQ0902999.1 F-type H+-transporting ATPase subunit delta [Paenibacillus sp. V4I7]MDQ0918525.1 F-type H+-transporting ATPase subunit delta [Paenibacillus sp. V4I5]